MLYTINDTALSALGSAIRSKTGGQGLLTPAEMASAVDTLYGTKDICYRTFSGSDSPVLSVSLPWKPSVFYCASQDAAGWSTPYTYMGVNLDMDSVAVRKAVFYLLDGESAVRTNNLSASSFSKYISYANGVLTFDLTSLGSYYAQSLWRNTVNYTMLAVRSVSV